MNWWILTTHEHARSLHHLFVVSRTNHPAHLFMAWARHPPARRPLWRTVRGTRIFCGYTYWWDTPTLTHQNEPLATFYHTFGPITLAAADHVWYYILSLPTPTQRACQSALFHVPPAELHAWTTKAYVGTHLKGIYYTHSFTGPGGTHPTWSRHNHGLHSLNIWQLEPDPLGVQYRHYCLAGHLGDRILYQRTPAISPTWLPLLTNAQACTLTGSASGELCWVATNINHPAHLYVLFNSALTTNGTWCLRSLDYGATWAAFQIYADIFNYHAGNIMAGITQGTSPHPTGDVLYAALATGALGGTDIYLSTDDGATWAWQADPGSGLQTVRCLVDPTDQSIVYSGAFLGGAHTHELFRSENHGAAPVQVDGAHHLGINIEPFRVPMWINPTDQAFLTVLADNHLYISIDYSLTWTDTGPIAHPCTRLALLWENPDRFYLARHISGTPGPPYSNCHVIFASEDYGATMYGKSGQWACDPTGHGDSIPYNCGGVCLQGMMLFPPY